MRTLKILRIIIAIILLAFIVILIFTQFDILSSLNEIFLEYEEYGQGEDPIIVGMQRILDFVSNFIKLIIIFFMILIFIITFSNTNSIKRGKGKLFLFFALFFNLLFTLILYSNKFSLISQSIGSFFSDLGLVAEFFAFIYFALLSVYCATGIAVSYIKRKKTDKETDKAKDKKLCPAEPELNAFTRFLGAITMIYFFINMGFFILFATFIDLINFFADSQDFNPILIFVLIAIFFLVQFIITTFSLKRARKGKGIILFIEIFIVSIFLIYLLTNSIIFLNELQDSTGLTGIRLIILSFVPFAYSVMGLIGTLRIRKELKDSDVIQPQAIEVKEKPANPAAYNYW